MTDAQQFEAFMRNYQNMVFSTAMRLLANHAEAEDMAQEVFLRAYERFGELSASPTAGGWLKTVATNCAGNGDDKRRGTRGRPEHQQSHGRGWRFRDECCRLQRGSDD